MVRDVRVLGVEDVLDAVEAWQTAQRDLEAQIFAAAAHFADLHHPDSRRVETGRVLPGVSAVSGSAGSAPRGCWSSRRRSSAHASARARTPAGR